MGKSKGLIISSFMPVHAGHEYLIAFAQNFVPDLTLLLKASKSDPIEPAVRCKWLTELAPHARIEVTNSDDEPAKILENFSGKVDYLFGSESSGWQAAESLGCRYIPVDPVVSFAAEEILRDPTKHWELLAHCARSYFVRRVCIFGPESTGKSTLTLNLAKHFSTVAVPEYARTHIDSRNNELSAEDLPLFARGQIASEDALARHSNRVMFCDTDAIITSIWSDWLYGSCPDSVKEIADRHAYDLYLLTDVDVPWVADPQRYLPEERQSFFERCKKELVNRNRDFVVISGDWDCRFQKAVAAVEKLLSDPKITPKAARIFPHSGSNAG